MRGEIIFPIGEGDIIPSPLAGRGWGGGITSTEKIKEKWRKF